MRWIVPRWLGAAVASLGALATQADEKLVLLDDVPREHSLFEVAADGSRLYFGVGGKFLVFDANAKLVDRFGVPHAARELVPLPDGWFIAFNSHADGHIALCRPDGTPAKTLVRRGGDEKHLRADMTGWTSPTGGAADYQRKLLFALDTSMGQRGEPDPVWSRVALFDFDGKYLRDINRYDGKARDADDTKRTWYDDIELDPARERVYVTARNTRELLAFAYDGKPVGKAPGAGGIAVFPDGRVAVGARDGRGIQLYDPDLKPLRVLPLQGLQDLEADANGRLYASVSDPSVTFVRWPPDLEKSEVFGPRYLRIHVEFPEQAATAGKLLDFKVRVEGRPAPERTDLWQVLARPSDGSDLRWISLPKAIHEKHLREGILTASVPDAFCGFYEIAVRFGAGPIAWAERQNDPYLQRTFAFAPKDAKASLAVITASGRRVFRQGEPIPLHIIRRAEKLDPIPVRLGLFAAGREKGAKALSSATVTVAANFAAEIPAALTERLIPGDYELRPDRPDRSDRSDLSEASYPLRFSISPSAPDSPMQRIMYHEFDTNPVTTPQHNLADIAEQQAFIRDYVEEVARLGFTRETDRMVGQLNARTGPQGWRRDASPVPLKDPAFAPPEYYAIPSGAGWAAERYLDLATRYGIRYDTQLLGHCSGVRFRDEWLKELVPILQRTAQWLGKFPSFYGFNYNDEMFFGQWVTDWTQEDKDWLKAKQEGEFKGRPMADVYMHALRTMYSAFNEGVRQALPRAKITTTPMWQFPAVEGSYPPVIYEGMDESYSHFLSEGYHYPWYPAHSVDILRRPGKPLMGVFDNSYSGQGGDGYLQDMVQVLGRGVQGVGAQHTKPFQDPQAASAYRVGNLIAKMYGPIFAECPPANEAAVLYSYTQDVTERRNSMGTPHWERVFALHTAGLMAGVPMSIMFEEDVADGWLLVRSGREGEPPGEPQKPPAAARPEPRPPTALPGAVSPRATAPRVPMLFLVGQTKPLPPKVQEEIAKFIAAGGKVFADAESADFPGATKLSLKTHELKSLWHEGYAADTIYPLFAPVQEKLARELREAVGKHRRFPVDTDTSWVAKNVFDGGSIRYILLATDEGAPFPWDARTVWSLGAVWRFSVLPTTTTLSFPDTGGVVYDVFEHRIVRPHREGKTAKLSVDLRTFPGRLYAFAPAILGPPRFAGMHNGHLIGPSTLSDFVPVFIVDHRGRRVHARVPIRIRLRNRDLCVREMYRGTDETGMDVARVRVPLTGDAWTIEVTELLGGQTSVLPVTRRSTPNHELVRSADAEWDPHEEHLGVERVLDYAITKGGSRLTVVVPDDQAISEAQRAKLTDVLNGKYLRIKAQFTTTMPKDVTPGAYLVLGYLPRREKLGEVLSTFWDRGLFPHVVSENVPGPGRGFLSAAAAPRGYGEHVIAVVGGDLDGLRKSVDLFLRRYQGDMEPPRRDVLSPLHGGGRLENLRVETVPPASAPRLRDSVGVKLSGVQVAADGKHLLVTAKGYLRNAALVEDRGTRARVERAVRIGQAPTVGGACVAPDGLWFGAAARVVPRFGEGFHLVDSASGRMKVFASFGDIGRAAHHFAVSPDGDTVIAPGTYGVVCWRRVAEAPARRGLWPFRRAAQRRDEWKEAWSLDYWKEFPKLDWPVSEVAERIPQFHAFIAPTPVMLSEAKHLSGDSTHSEGKAQAGQKDRLKAGLRTEDPLKGGLRTKKDGGYALVLFGEFSNQGWVTPDQHCKAALSAVSLADGKELWRFDVPILKTLLFPTLHTSPDGSHLLLQVQMGSWNKETFRFFTIDASSGKAVASWDCRYAPLGVAVADATGQIAFAFKERLLEMRRPDGTLVYNMLWRNQPIGVAFARDGQRLFVADDAGRLALLDAEGNTVWMAETGCGSAIAAAGGRVYAAGWDGRLRAYAAEEEDRLKAGLHTQDRLKAGLRTEDPLKGGLRTGRPIWTLDLTPELNDPNPMAMVAASAKYPEGSVLQAARPSTLSGNVPDGPSLLRTGKATLKLGGTPGWMSEGKVLVKAEELTNGKLDDVATPWLHLDELFWDATAGRQVWAEITFESPTDVKALTVYENPRFPHSFPTEGLVQVWNEGLKRWDTAAFGVWLTGPVNTYPLGLRAATRIRYVPWNSYYRNFYTSEIEVR